MTKFNKQELISNYPNCTCINPKLNGNKRILFSKSGMHPTEAEGQKPKTKVLAREILPATQASQNVERRTEW